MKIFLGIDAGTQSVKAELIEVERGEIIATETTHFGRELPQYHSPNGFVPNPDHQIRQADPLMWLEALDSVLAKLQKSGAPLNMVAGISGSGQQHGSVYLNGQFQTILAQLDPAKGLAKQIRPALARKLAPIWMDHSTTLECKELNDHFGDRLQHVTGSPAIERFTGPQLRRFARMEPASWQQTKVVHLVSSFLASVLAGESMPIDYGDGAGMNLLNLETLDWDKEIIDFTAPDLRSKLPKAARSDVAAGKLAGYFAKYGLTPGIPIVPFSGDNPNSLVGTGATAPGTAVISLGTSDTFFAAMEHFHTDPAGCGHIFGNPAGGFMSLICFANGSLARERIREACQVDFDFFDQTSGEITPPGNGGKLMLPYFETEITPPVANPQVHYNFDPKQVSPAEQIRAVLESQALSMRAHSEWQMANFTRIRVTGGASRSYAFRQILADVFQSPIETITVADSAALGAALRAANAVGGYAFELLYEKFCAAVETVKPVPERKELYNQMLKSFRAFEAEYNQ